MFSRNNPLTSVERRVLSLKNSIDNSVSRSRRERIEPDHIVGTFFGRHAAFASLWSSVRKEVRAWPVYHAISLVGFDAIASSFSAFVADLEEVHRKLPPGHTQRVERLLSAVRRETRRLGAAIDTLDERIRSQRVRVVRSHGHNIEEFVKIQSAMASIDKEGAKDLDVDEVDNFSDWPGFDLDDAVQVGKIARLIFLDRNVHQKYELRCRLAKPGRPLMGTKCTGFPTPQEVEEFSSAWDEPEKIYVAAAKPTWRIVWTFKRESGGWYW